MRMINSQKVVIQQATNKLTHQNYNNQIHKNILAYHKFMAG